MRTSPTYGNRSTTNAEYPLLLHMLTLDVFLHRSQYSRGPIAADTHCRHMGSHLCGHLYSRKHRKHFHGSDLLIIGWGAKASPFRA
jgi:hypothetical protein